MKLHYLIPVIVFVLLLFGAIGSAMSQSTSFLFGSSDGIPTRLFGSSEQYGCETACAQKTSYVQKTSCAQKASCAQKSRYGFAQKSCAVPQTEMAMVPEYGPACGCESSCDVAPSKGCGDGCGCGGGCGGGLRRCGVSSLLGKFDSAVKGLFHSKRSGCCEPCCYQTQCCPITPTYGYELGCGTEAGREWVPLPQEAIEPESLEGDPFEDDPVELLAPPIPSEARYRANHRLPIGPVTYVRPASHAGLASPGRFRPSNPTPIKKSVKKSSNLRRSVLDRVD